MRCGIYTRVSTDNQVEKIYNSLETQKESAISYIQSHKFEGWTHEDTFEDGGYSGATLDRPDLKRMLRVIKKKGIDAVLVYKVDRLTRNQKDFYQLIDYFEKYGVTFISITQNFDTSSAAGRLMRNIMLDFAQFEREMTAERTKDKLCARAKRGMWNGGCVPLGYINDKENKVLLVDPEEEKLVKLIFQKYIELKSISKVVELINSNGYTTKTGGEFMGTTVGHILSNKKYLGLIEYANETYEGLHTGIIDQETFNKVQDILSRNKTGNYTPSENKYNLSLLGLVKCHYCGASLTSYYCIKDGKRYMYYKCSKLLHGNNKSCQMKALNAHSLDKAVIDKLTELGNDKAKLDDVINKVNGRYMEELESLEVQQGRHKEMLSKTKDKISKLIHAITDRDTKLEVIEDELHALEMKKKDLELKLVELNTRIVRLKDKIINAGVVYDGYRHFTSIYPTLLPKDKHRYMQSLVKEVDVSNDLISMCLYEPEGIKEEARTASSVHAYYMAPLRTV